MHQWIRAHLTYANVMATIAVFLVLSGGTAVALTGSNTVFSDDIVNGEVKDDDIGSNAVRSGKIIDGGVQSVDILDGAVGSPDILDGAVGNNDVHKSAINSGKVQDDSLTGADVAEPTLGQVPSALLGGFGRSGSVVTCNPEGSAFTPCAGTEILNVPPGARALVLGRARAFVEADSFAGDGTCRLTASSIGAVPGSDMSFSVDDDTNSSENGTLVAITPSLPTGATSFGIECNDQAPVNGLGTEYREVAASVVLISDA